jgi:predicted enzyme related to lactoylglutathione lyase
MVPVGDLDEAITDGGRGAVVRTAPFDIGVGRCAVLEDPFGNAVCVLDLSKGER